MRRLDDHFLNDLRGGVLADLTTMVRSDTSLCLELRGQSINVYYRGGSLMKVEKKLSRKYTVFFDPKYFRKDREIALPPCEIDGKEGIEKWLKIWSELKHAMDCYFGKNPADEREFQQLLVRDNNFGSIANSTDYYICDIEYASDNGRFDMIAVHWPSTTSERMKGKDRRMVLVEVKHGDGALTGKAGLHKHIEDINKYLSNSETERNLKQDMVQVFKQKRGLKLVECKRELWGIHLSGLLQPPRSRSRGMMFYRVLELAVGHAPVRYLDLVASRRRQKDAASARRLNVDVRGARNAGGEPTVAGYQK